MRLNHAIKKHFQSLGYEPKKDRVHVPGLGDIVLELIDSKMTKAAIHNSCSYYKLPLPFNWDTEPDLAQILNDPEYQGRNFAYRRYYMVPEDSLKRRYTLVILHPAVCTDRGEIDYPRMPYIGSWFPDWLQKNGTRSN